MNRQLGLLWGGVAGVLILASPFASTLASGVWTCWFKELTGFACPTCGTVRAAVALSQLDLASALTRYPLPSLAWLTFIGGGLVALALSITHRPLPSLPARIPAWIKAGALVAVLANWIYAIWTGV